MKMDVTEYIKNNYVNVRSKSRPIFICKIENRRKKDGWLKLKGNKFYEPMGYNKGGFEDYYIEVPEGEVFNVALKQARREIAENALKFVFDLDDEVVQILGTVARKQLIKELKEWEEIRGVGNALMFGQAEVMEALDILF